jgi:hypothetical protein
MLSKDRVTYACGHCLRAQGELECARAALQHLAPDVREALAWLDVAEKSLGEFRAILTNEEREAA